MREDMNGAQKVLQPTLHWLAASCPTSGTNWVVKISSVE